jgi:hypothetical protein
MKIKQLEPVIILATASGSLVLPYLPMFTKSMLPGYFLLFVAFLQCLVSAVAACIAIGFCLFVASIVFAFIHRWGTAAVLSILAFCGFGLIAALELFYFKVPIGYGLAILLAALFIHACLSMIWHLRFRSDPNRVSLPQATSSP